MKIRILFLSITGHQVLSPKNPPFLSPHPDQLRHDVNTDELYPVQAMSFFVNISHYALTGDRMGRLKVGEVKSLSPNILVAGHNFGCGSAREHPVIALQELGVKAIFASSFNETFRQNCLYLGIHTSTNLNHLEKVIGGGATPLGELLEEFQGIEKKILTQGGLFNYNLARLEEKKAIKTQTAPRPMTAAERIIVQHLENKSSSKAWVQPGDQVFVSVDFRMSYELFTPLMAQLLTTHAPNQSLKDPSSIILVADHFITSRDPQVKQLIKTQEAFAKKHKTILYVNKGNQAKGICHTLMIQNHLLPGQLAAGTDSHSGMWGVLGALGIPVGATAMANAFLTKDVLLAVPHSIKVNFQGKLPKDCSARDVMFHLMVTLPLEKTQGTILEFDISQLDWSLDELSVLTNQAKEAGALTSFMVPNETVIKYLMKKRNLSRKKIEKMIVKSDLEAEYLATYTINLNDTQPMVALPRNPKDAIPVSQLSPRPKITKAFIGSCVGGKWEDIKRAVKILKGKKVAKGIQLVVQPASEEIYKKAVKRGFPAIIKKAGGLFQPPNCGACIGQGPGRVRKKDISISTSTRNYPGRMGPGKVYLGSPETVAASAIAGEIRSN